jgi:DNA mismatch repair protein MutL
MFGMHSLGFRGEALASINAIAHMIIETNGHKLENEKITPSNFANGTRIEIKNIFANLPARLKFLKSNSIEWAYIKSVLEKFIINNCQIGWKVFNNHKLLWHFNANETSQNRLKTLFNHDGHYFFHEYQNIKINGYILNTSTRNFNAIFINKRCVLDKSIARYMRNIFSEYYMKHEIPGYIINVEIDPILVDCNVHPSKDEVRILSYSEILSMLSFIFSPHFFTNIFNEEKENLNIYHMHKQVKPSSNDNVDFSKPIMFDNQIEEAKLNLIFEKDTKLETDNYIQNNVILNQAFLTKANSIDQNNEIIKHQHKIIGQIKNSFIMFETENGIGIFDQHAAHERNVYEKMKTQMHKDNAQQLLIPIMLNLNAEQNEYINANLEALANKGIILKDNHLTHIPSILPGLDFANLIEKTLEIRTPIAIMLDRLLANLACKNALKANTKLAFEQMSQLLETALTNVPVCNHGRPVFKYFNMNEIETWFRRK